MKDRWKKISLYIAMTMIMVSCLTACGKNKGNNEAATATPQAEAPTPTETEKEELEFDDEVLKVGSVSVTYREALIYILQIKNQYAPSYGNGLWGFQVDEESTFSDYAKEEIINEISQLKILTQQAEELKITLTNDELDEIAQSVRSYMEKITAQDQETYGITEEVVTQVLSDNYLAQKVFTISTNEVDTNISDEEAKQIKLQQLVVLTKGTDKNGVAISMTEEEKKAALKRAKSLLDEAKASSDFQALAKSESDISTVDLTLGKGDNAELEAAAFKLKKEELSDIIETKSGYVILYCVNDNDEEATAAAKEEIIANRQNEAFSKKFKTWAENYKVTVKSSAWDKIKFE